MSKPLPVRIPSDDCQIVVAGQVANPHEGEWVEVRQGFSVGEMLLVAQMNAVGGKLAAVKGEPDEGTRTFEILNESYDGILRAVSSRVVAWSWTDDAGRPFPEPDGSVTPFLALRTEELHWLLNAVQGETAQARGKGSKNLETTSSASEPTPIQRLSTSARSRTRR